MATESSLPRDVDAHIVTLLTKLSALREATAEPLQERRQPMSIEARSLELWGAVAVECFATFIFSFVVFGATESATHILSVLATALASGLAIAAIYIIFGMVSGKLKTFIISSMKFVKRFISEITYMIFVNINHLPYLKLFYKI